MGENPTLVSWPTVNFIKICTDFEGEERLQNLSNNLGISIGSLIPYRDSLERTLNFVRVTDWTLHEIVGGSAEGRVDPFLEETLHGHLASDLRAMLALCIVGQPYQSNVVLRHFIETVLMTLWADTCSRFQGSFRYFLDTSEWKPYRLQQRVTWEMETSLPHRSVKERLERIRLLNGVQIEGRDWYHRYLSQASGCDLIILLSLPICRDCVDRQGPKIGFKEFHLHPDIRAKGLEDKHARFRSDFSLTCSFCGRQRLAEGFVRGIPDVPVMCDMTVAMVEDTEVNWIRELQQVYNHLSEEFVHFSTTVHPDREPEPAEIGGRRVKIWGLSGIECVTSLCSSLFLPYFKRMRGQSKSKVSRGRPSTG